MSRSPIAKLALGIVAACLFGVLGALGWLWWLWSETPDHTRATISTQKRRLVMAMASIALIAPMVGLLMTAIGLEHSFGAVSGETIDASQKSRVLAEGISTAMRWTAIGLGVMVLGTIAILVAGYRLARVNASVILDSRSA